MTDNTYKLISFTEDQTISKTEYTTVYSFTGKGFIDCIVFNVDDTDMLLNIVLDNENVIDGFLLKDLGSKYNFSDDVGLPLTEVGNNTFRYRLRSLQGFKQSLQIELKHNKKINKKLVAGYITKE
jgi:hypothetical protein